MMAGPELIDLYILGRPPQAQAKLREIRKAIRSVAPDATEIISYQMPTFYYNGNLVYFAGYERHIGFYPGANGISEFEKELGEYKHAKGSIQFPLDKPLPISLIKRIVKFRVEENSRKALRPRKRKP